MLQIIQNIKGFHIVNVTLGSVMATCETLEEATKLKNKILS